MIKLLSILSLILVLFTIQCEKQKPNDSSLKPEDQNQISLLIKNVYKWHENEKTNNDLTAIPDAKDSLYVSIDLNKHKLRLNEFEATGFFSKEFLDNYDTIVKTINRNLETKKYEWLFGDMPPFHLYGDDVDPWCFCQDTPNDSAFDNLKINIIAVENNNVDLQWTWNDEEWSKKHKYEIMLVKINEKWKIKYMEGFKYPYCTEEIM